VSFGFSEIFALSVRTIFSICNFHCFTANEHNVKSCLGLIPHDCLAQAELPSLQAENVFGLLQGPMTLLDNTPHHVCLELPKMAGSLAINRDSTGTTIFV
jgi:hypothetical protein